MQFESIIFFFACAAGLMASPLAEHQHSTDILTSNDYVEHYREPVANGTLVYLGYAEDAPSGVPTPTRSRATKVEARKAKAKTTTTTCAAATATPECSTKYSARNDICDQLVTELQGDSQIAVPESPRQI
jgi:hypothetical protein